MKNLFSTCILLFFILLSCSNNSLTREKAKKIILEKIGNPWVEYEAIDISGLDQTTKRRLVDDSLFTETYSAYNFSGNGYSYHASQKGKAYYLGKVNPNTSEPYFAVGCGVLDEITGIHLTEENKKAIVEYTWKRKGTTIFGDILGFKNGETGPTYSVTMDLYDDGWRIENYNSNLRGPEFYPFFTKDGDYKENK